MTQTGTPETLEQWESRVGWRVETTRTCQYCCHWQYRSPLCRRVTAGHDGPWCVREGEAWITANNATCNFFAPNATAAIDLAEKGA